MAHAGECAVVVAPQESVAGSSDTQAERAPPLGRRQTLLKFLPRSASVLPGNRDDCATPVAASPEKIEILNSAFEQGIWNQHLADQANRAAPVQGVRFFYAPVQSTPASVRGRSEDEALLLGHYGYVTLLPETVQIDEGTGHLKLSLAQHKTWLQSKKAWESNRKAFAALVGTVVPVIYMQHGRPEDKRFGCNDALLGTFLLTENDANVLSCVLSPAPYSLGSAGSHLDKTTVKQLSHNFLSEGKGVKRCRKELPVFSPLGGFMGPVGSFACNGTACKDTWITHIQRAKVNIRINAFCISDPDIIEELHRAAAPGRGVSVRLRYDARQQARTHQGIFEDNRMRYIHAHPVELSADDRFIMHKKELMVDVVLTEDYRGIGHKSAATCLVIGSYNPTAKAIGNQESVVVVSDAATLWGCALCFDQDWAQEIRNHERELGAQPPGLPQAAER